MPLAPIILFVFKRPELTLEVLSALSNNNLAADSTLYIFCDGFRINDTDDDRSRIERTRQVVKKEQWCKEVNIVEREHNLGLANSILSGVDEVMHRHGKAIVLEDDIVPTPYFLQYMNDALDTYERNSKVLSIGACNFFANDERLPETFFIPIPDCWGWATWDNRWLHFERNGRVLLTSLREKGIIDKFNLYGKYDFERMLIDQIEGKNSSWAIRWQAHSYISETLTLYPKYSVVKNLGFDVDATHGGSMTVFQYVRIALRRINVAQLPVEENRLAISLMLNSYGKIFSKDNKFKLKYLALKRKVLKMFKGVSKKV